MASDGVAVERKRGKRGTAQVVVEDAAFPMPDHVEGTGNAECSDRCAARDGFEHDESERVGPARKYEYVSAAKVGPQAPHRPSRR
jgi:hypothetical protein